MLRAARPLTVLLIAFALALRMWVPAGWMPAPGAHNFAIMPCPAAEPAPMAHMGHGSHGGHQQSHGKDMGDCFAPLLAGVAVPDSPIALPAPTAAPVSVQAPVAPDTLARGPPAPPPPSTGPPAIA